MHDRDFWQAPFINNKTLTIERGNVLGKMFNFSTYPVPFIKIPCKCDTSGMSLKYISELIIEKSYLRKKSDDLSAYEKLFLHINHEKGHVREKPYELIQNIKYVSQNEDFFPYEKIKHVEQSFEYKECGEDFCEKTVSSHINKLTKDKVLVNIMNVTKHSVIIQFSWSIR